MMKKVYTGNAASTSKEGGSGDGTTKSTSANRLVKAMDSGNRPQLEKKKDEELLRKRKEVEKRLGVEFNNQGFKDGLGVSNRVGEGLDNVIEDHREKDEVFFDDICGQLYEMMQEDPDQFEKVKTK